MRKIFLSSCLLLAFLCSAALAAKLPRLKVVSPKQLSAQFERKEGSGIEFGIADFGNIPYGINFIGALIHPKVNNTCDYIPHLSNGEDMYYDDQHLILILRLGTCLPSVLAWNAQNAGAKMLIIINNDDKITNKMFETYYEYIAIPTIVISKSSGDKVLKFIEKIPFPPLNPEDTAPILSINFPYEEESNTVALDFWYATSDTKLGSYEFLYLFQQYIKDEAFKFTPHFVSWDCYECRFANYQSPVDQDCISGGRYCAPDPDEEGPLEGKDVVLENLRQACMWKHQPSIYWNYIETFPADCLSAKAGNIEKCSEEAFTHSAVLFNKEAIINCMQNTFVTKNDQKIDITINDNTILKEEKRLQQSYGITEYPVLLINHKPYSGNLTDMNSVMKAVCKKFTTKPQMCKDLGFDDPKNRSYGKGILITVLVLLTIAAVALFACVRKVSKKSLGIELSTEANNMVSRYMSVAELGGMKDNEE